MKRLLCITASMNAGGAETFLMKIYRMIDKEKYQMDFCVVAKENYYAKEIETMGGKIYFIPLKSKHPIASFTTIRKIVKDNNYDYVMRVNEHSLSTIDLIAAKCGGAKRVIMRSSNASSSSKRNILLHKMFKGLSKYIPDIKLAPSTEAAEYTFGKNCIQNGKAFILKNGLDLEKFRFDENIRKEYRKILNLDGKLVIGHIGRFNTQKNHDFLIEIFSEIRKKREDAMLLLVGEGTLQDDIRRKVKSMGLDEDVKFLGVRKDIPSLLCAMDFFLFPSFYEGMPNTVIEAQTNGLPCMISENITKEAAITKCVKFISLDKLSSEWAEKAVDFFESFESNREDIADEMKENGYDIHEISELFVKKVFLES